MLTPGELDLLWPIFGRGIDYSIVRIHKGKYLFGLQSDDVVMTPNGEQYWPNILSLPGMVLQSGKINQG